MHRFRLSYYVIQLDLAKGVYLHNLNSLFLYSVLEFTFRKMLFTLYQAFICSLILHVFCCNVHLCCDQVERERGITVKAQTATMFYRYTTASQDSDAPRYLLNLIDTPGHVDFSYEVSRSLAACQGALLVVDAAQGVQAQTIANFYLAFESNLSIIPVINKIDQPTADPDNVKDQLKRLFDIDPSEALLTSAKTGKGLEHVLPAVIERIPSPPGKCDSPVRMLLLDSYYDEYKGVICHVAVVDGALRKGDKIASAATGRAYEVLDVGIMHPELTPTGVLYTGQVGYVISGMRSTKEARIGDTLHQAKSTVEPLPGMESHS